MKKSLIIKTIHKISPPRRQDAKLKLEKFNFLTPDIFGTIIFKIFNCFTLKLKKPFLAPWRLGGGIGFCVFLFLSPVTVQAEPEKWTFLPSSPLFQPLIGDPREPDTSVIAYLNETRFEGSVGDFFELLRYEAPDKTKWGWGIFGSGYILLGVSGVTFPMLDTDWYAGMYLSESSGDFSYRLEYEHQSSHLGDSFEGNREPIIYNGENLNFTGSFKPSENFRFYAGAGAWDNLYPPDNALFASLGTEIYSPSMAFIGTSLRGYATIHLKWKAQAGGVLDKTAQLGLQWKFKKEESRAVRLALVYYNGNSEFGQFYLQHDEHLGIGVYFDP
jgi:hypothetical protein